MEILEKLLENGFEAVDLKKGNVKVGDDVANRNGIFGRLKNITKRGNYMVQFDMDETWDAATRFSAEQFEQFFLVDTRK